MEFFSPGHLLVLAIVVIVLFFGWKQLPDMARSLGRSLRIFKTEIKGMTEDDKAREAAAGTPAVTPAPSTAPPAAVTPVVNQMPLPPIEPASTTVTTPARNMQKPVDPAQQ